MRREGKTLSTYLNGTEITESESEDEPEGIVITSDESFFPFTIEFISDE